jgi:hypothetical protein
MQTWKILWIVGYPYKKGKFLNILEQLHIYSNVKCRLYVKDTEMATAPYLISLKTTRQQSRTALL